MSDRARERDLRYHRWLDQIVEHLRDDRRREAAQVINEIRPEELRDFTFYLALHIAEDLNVLSHHTREHTREILARDTPNPN